MAPAAVDVRPGSVPNILPDPRSGLSAQGTAIINNALRHEEYQYLDLIRDILQNGEHRPDRYDFRFPAIVGPTLIMNLQNRNRNLFYIRASSAPLCPLSSILR